LALVAGKQGGNCPGVAIDEHGREGEGAKPNFREWDNKSPAFGSRGASLIPVDGIPDPVAWIFDLPMTPDEV
jgi:hypothetical protein